MESVPTGFFGTLLHEKYGITVDMSWAFSTLRFPLWGLVFYLLSIQLLAPKSNQPRSSQSKCERKFGQTETVMFIHNVILAVFSFLTFINSTPIVYDTLTTYGLYDGLCEKLKLAHDETSYGLWVYLFYLSKFYEFIDTWIVIARGRRPITLQVYHHCGAVIGMWLVLITKTSASFWFVVQNSFIHSIMYTYYACSVVGIQFRFKFVITLLQMYQFVIGLSGAVWQLWYCWDCSSIEDKFVTFYHVVYVGLLFKMFAEFYAKSYKKEKKK
jgi:hypothetical protein